VKRLGALGVIELMLALGVVRFPRLLAAAGGPEAGSWGELSEWYDRAAPQVLVVVTGVLLIGGLLGWLLLASTLQLLAELIPTWTRFRRLADLVAPALLRRIGRRVGEATVAAGLLLGPFPSLAGTGPPVAARPPQTATITPLDPAPAPSTSTVAEPAPPNGPVPTAPAQADPRSVVVEPGDSFWSIAERAVGSGGGHPTEHEVATYWQVLMAANRHRLRVEGVFDLIYPGQELVLPEVGRPAPSRLPDTL
jgi:hypothetical protein